MRKLGTGLYEHRGKTIIKDTQGIWVNGCLHLFKYIIDAKEYINKLCDGTNKIEPRIVGEWTDTYYDKGVWK